MSLLYEEDSYKIRAAFLSVWKSLGSSFKETTYQKALIIEFEKQGLKVERQKQIPIFYDGQKVGSYVPDFVINGKIVIELKAVPYLTDQHKKQFWRYLKGSEYRLGFLVNFGGKDITIIRKVYDTARVVRVRLRQRSLSACVRGEKGIVLIVALLALLVSAIFLPALIYVVSNETKWSVKQKKTSIAFHMAEAGLDRGIWKLQESDWHWTVASTGGVIPGYNFDTVYTSTGTDGKLGEYKIKLSSYSGGTGVVIQSIGRDKSTDEVRALEAAYSKTQLAASAIARGGDEVEWNPNLELHWGPFVSYANIENLGNNPGQPQDWYPRKIAKGFIENRDTNPDPPNGHDFYSTWPDPATYDYNSYQTNLGNPPVIDLASYKQKAKDTRVSGSLNLANLGQNPAGSGYFEWDGDGDPVAKIERPTGGNADRSWYLFCSTCVLYFDGKGEKLKVELKGGPTSQLRIAALIVDGRVSDSEFDFDGNTDVPPIPNIKIPIGAKKEYAHPNAASVWTNRGWNEGDLVSISTARVHGYIYVKGSIRNSGGANPVMVGTVDVEWQFDVTNFTIYYDAAISTGVLYQNAKPSLQYWREIKKEW